MDQARPGSQVPASVRWLMIAITMTAAVFTGVNWFLQSRAATASQNPNLIHRVPCPGCRTETTFGPTFVNTRTKCAKCGREFVLPDPAKGGSRFFILPGLMIALVALLVSVWLFLTRSSRVREEHCYIFHCPRCRSKLRFQGSQAGRAGLCPRCSAAFEFPTDAELAD
jgi:transposase-like protein